MTNTRNEMDGLILRLNVARIVLAEEEEEEEEARTVVSLLDVTERKRAEEERNRLLTDVQQHAAELDAIFTALPYLVSLHEKDGKYLRVNPTVKNVFGFDPVNASREEIAQRLKAHFPDGQPLTPRNMPSNRALAGEAVHNIEYIITDVNGNERTLLYNAIPWKVDGEVQGAVFAQEDITERKRAEEALRNREDVLQRIFDILPVGLWFADKDGKLLRGNPAGVKIWGAEPKVSPSEYGVFKARRLPSGEEVAPDDWALAHTIRDRVTIVDELLEIDAFDGKQKTILNYTAPVLDDQGNVQGAIVVNQDITERKRAEDELRQSREQLRALAGYLESARENERARIAREIHDDFGQSMTALKIDLTWLTKRLPEGDARVERIRAMTALVDGSIAQMRRIATELRPGVLDDLGLNAALEWQAQEFSRRSEIPCNLKLPSDDLALDPALSTTLFRIFQETLTNVARHAQATRVDAMLQQEGNTLILTVQDNGRGVTESELKDPRSLGLLGLRERAVQWGGDITLVGAPGEGTTVTVRIPLPVSSVNGGNR